MSVSPPEDCIAVDAEQLSSGGIVLSHAQLTATSLDDFPVEVVCTSAVAGDDLRCSTHVAKLARRTLPHKCSDISRSADYRKAIVRYRHMYATATDVGNRRTPPANNPATPP